MKRIFAALILALILLPAAAYGDERAYTFELAVNGSDSCHAVPGDTVTVTLTLRRTMGDGPMYAMQDEILFDPTFFEYQEDSALLHSGVATALMPLRDGRQAVYMSFVSFGSGSDWADEVVVGSFRLKVLSDSGVSKVTNSSYRVSTEDGMEFYTAAAQDVSVMVSDQCTVTFESNGGSAVQPQTVRHGSPLQEPAAPTRDGYDFGGWYTDFDLTKPWDFSLPVNADMTLYALWRAQTVAQPTAWVWYVAGAALLVLVVALVLRRKGRRT